MLQDLDPPWITEPGKGIALISLGVNCVNIILSQVVVRTALHGLKRHGLELCVSHGLKREKGA